MRVYFLWFAIVSFAASPASASCCDPETGTGCSPIVVNFAAGDYRLTGADAGVSFDIAASGTPFEIGWTAAGADEAFLWLDRNVNGRVDDGSELFGTATPLADGSTAPNGFVALAEYDDDRDGQINDGDAVWTRLRLWRDFNHDGRSQSEEIRDVSASPINAIELTYRWTGRQDQYGNLFKYQSRVWLTRRDGQPVARPLYDIFFSVRQSETNAATAFATAGSRFDGRQAMVAARELYDTLWSAEPGIRVQRFQELQSTEKFAVWAYYLNDVLGTHPEYTPEQRAVIQYALSVLEPAIYEIQPGDARWSAVVDEPLRELTRRAQAVFPAAVAKALFAQIAPPATSPPAHENGAALGRRRPAVNDFPTCTCSTVSDWCGSDYTCEQRGGCYFASTGCGTLLAYSCIGMCYFSGSGGG